MLYSQKSLYEYGTEHFTLNFSYMLWKFLMLLKVARVGNIQKQPFRGVHKKRFSENIQQIYRRTPMPKCDFNKVAL